jgi:hypothetical protein
MTANFANYVTLWQPRKELGRPIQRNSRMAKTIVICVTYLSKKYLIEWLMATSGTGGEAKKGFDLIS